MRAACRRFTAPAYCRAAQLVLMLAPAAALWLPLSRYLQAAAAGLSPWTASSALAQRRRARPFWLMHVCRYLVDRARDRLSHVLRGGSSAIGGSGDGCSATCEVLCSDALPPGQCFDVIHVSLIARLRVSRPCHAARVCVCAGGVRRCRRRRSSARLHQRAQRPRRHDRSHRHLPRRHSVTATDAREQGEQQRRRHPT